MHFSPFKSPCTVFRVVMPFHKPVCHLFCRIGKVVMLNLGTTVPPCPAFVHTVWPCGKKPRPISQEIPIQSLKTFRATMLVRHKKSKEDLDEECYWEPSPNTWMYGQEHLLAILDVDTQRTAVNRGHFFLTPASEDMILKVQSEEHPAAPHRGLNVKKRRKPPKLKLGAALKKAASAKIAKKAQEAPTPSSIRRSVAGRRMVRFMMKKALEVDAVRFADNPVFNPNTGSCTLKGCTSYTYDIFMEQVPLYFQALHVKVRNAERYGLLVYKTITDLTQQMEQNPAKRSLLLNIIQDAIKAKLGQPKI